jgi:hypothetical protein
VLYSPAALEALGDARDCRKVGVHELPARVPVAALGRQDQLPLPAPGQP